MNDYTSSLALDVKPSGFHKDYRLVKFVGNLDKAGLEAVRAQIEEVSDQVKDEKYLVFDFELLEFINSESIGFLMMVHTHLEHAGKKLVIVNPVDHVKDVLDVIGLLKIIDCYPSLEEFEQSL